MRLIWILSSLLSLYCPAHAALAATESPTPSDPQIMAIVRAANQADIDAGQVARSRSKNPDIQAFAQDMIEDHEAANADAAKTAGKLKLKPEKNPQSDTVERSGKDTLAQLKKLKGSEFDRAYIAQEVAMHEQVLHDIDNLLLPNAKSEETRVLLKRIRPVVDHHLEHAKRIKASLENEGKST